MQQPTTANGHLILTLMSFSVQFSDLLQKLFVNMDKPCPVQFNVAVPDEPSHYNICSRIVYARPEHQRSTEFHSKNQTNQRTNQRWPWAERQQPCR